MTTRSDHESLSAAVAELGRRYASGEVSRERLDARLLELRICPGLRRSRSRALPSIPPPVIIFSIEEAVGANAGTHGRTPALAAGGLR